ncbi:duf1237 domain containing protein [Grosmannia clavigera kw1407]|uniref:Duf1237 domain containing protein n=1 Tax=Grosmannia clavigera (strain kw1407 / UAMH 11150) TaxID=655863 RepID=F0XHP7_GROCL|nr:duf1237 domain containing protein [Grosmannia clavigera kw1407]EFX02846.1 duf1237 domain containing protein [Grosmannia clavigera kw1407]
MPGPSQMILLAVGFSVAASTASCPDYSAYSKQMHEPRSNGSYRLSAMRPERACRTFHSSVVEQTIAAVQADMADPDLSRLFANAFPNTLDTAIRWHGVAADNAAEELTFVITGDIDAMWLRDSANQLQSYRSLLKADTNNSSNSSLASLYRGVINLQARYLLQAPFCNSFQPPAESALAPAVNDAAADDSVTPSYSTDHVFECKFELDSLAAFLQLSADYFAATDDAAFFARFRWLDAVQAVLHTAVAMQTPTYAANGSVLASPYTFRRQTTRATETLANDGRGSPVAAGTGLIRSAFRPSDDSTLLQLFIPANMIGLADDMHRLAADVRAAIARFGLVDNPNQNGSSVYAYEVDGFGSAVLMDDANIPSLLASPFFGFTTVDDPLYQNTRAAILNQNARPGNPYFMQGPVISAVGGPHDGPGMAWPMASIVRILTSDDDDEIAAQLKMLVSSTDGLGLIHESINSFNQSDWTRQWFSWVNGLFGQMILDLRERKPALLKLSYQP